MGCWPHFLLVMQIRFDFHGREKARLKKEKLWFCWENAERALQVESSLFTELRQDVGKVMATNLRFM